MVHKARSHILMSTGRLAPNISGRQGCDREGHDDDRYIIMGRDEALALLIRLPARTKSSECLFILAELP